MSSIQQRMITDLEISYPELEEIMTAMSTVIHRHKWTLYSRGRDTCELCGISRPHRHRYKYLRTDIEDGTKTTHWVCVCTAHKMQVEAAN